MQANELISAHIFPLKPGDTCGFAREMMAEWGVVDLPVVADQTLLGVLKAKDLIEVAANKKIDSLFTALIGYEVYDNNHLFQLLGAIGGAGFSVLPILKPTGAYAGAIALPNLLELTSKLLTIEQEGAIITLELDFFDYSLSEIARIAESDNIKVLGLIINKMNDSGKIRVHLKLNSWHINGIVASFNRYNYKIIGVYSTASVLDDLKSRYDSLMKYLDI